ncbi:hypothetical protein [Solibacillus daqui]|uniref:hypothetical protein n=1 Tax=Solibacillus daqui TaxID=2912187 RepID=UPI00236593AE|nr:hypothetical protein [Solibacillus daqui]
MFILKLLNLLFIGTQIYFSSKYKWKHSLAIALLFTLYVTFIFPHVTFQYIYLYLCLFLWLLFVAAFFQRDKLYQSPKSRTE